MIPNGAKVRVVPNWNDALDRRFGGLIGVVVAPVRNIADWCLVRFAAGTTPVPYAELIEVSTVDLLADLGRTGPTEG